MVSDTLEMDDEGIEEEADEEVDKVITEITSGMEFWEYSVLFWFRVILISINHHSKLLLKSIL